MGTKTTQLNVGAVAVRSSSAFASALEEAARAWESERGTARIWSRDTSLWADPGATAWLGWLDAPGLNKGREGRFESVLRAAHSEGITDVVVLGMGGSSLFPAVAVRCLAREDVGLRGHVVDSTDPKVVGDTFDRLDPATTLFVVSSKSGGTLETRALGDYAAARAKPPVSARRRMVYITDPGSALERHAQEQGSWGLFHGVAAIGGRFSALSDFGLVPAALVGADVPQMLRHARETALACQNPRALENPGALLGLALHVAVQEGRDRLTVVPDSDVAAFGAWLEQLVAESTGKQGKGVTVVDGEPNPGLACFGPNRVFLRLMGAEPDAHLNEMCSALEAAGFPVLVARAPTPEAVAGWIFAWEFATAVCGARLGVNPFDQPDVEATKAETKKALAAAGEPDDGFIQVQECAPALRELLARLGGEMVEVCILAFLPEDQAARDVLLGLRVKITQRTHAATTLGFGPRYLHSTGQLHKGGKNDRVFVVLRWDPSEHDRAIAGREMTFGQIERAQARADVAVLRERGRAVLAIDLGRDPQAGLGHLETAMDGALAGLSPSAGKAQ